MKYTIKLKIVIIILLVGLMIIPNFTCNSLEDNKTNIIGNNIIDLQVAIYSDVPLGWDVNAPDDYFLILEDYQWTVGNKTYKFVTTPIFDENILDGSINIDNYDVLLVPGGGVGDEQSIVKGFFSKIRPKVINWKNKLFDFIVNGGGYVGYCGGTALMCHLGKEPETFLENAYEKSSIGASDVKVYWKADGPSVFLDAWSAYTDETHGYPYYNGLCFDIPLNKNHPITDDFLDDTCRIRWIGGPSCIIPENPSSNITVLGQYPKEEISENESTRIQIWKYTGGVLGLIKGYFIGLKWLKAHNMPLSKGIVASIDFRYDWELTDEYVKLNYSNKPCMVAEVYPNENKGRLVLDTFHPEANVWWGGHFEVFPDHDENSVADGLYKLVDYKLFNETPEDEMTHTHWIVRREVAWAAKLPDNDLPPIYGPSQVCDFEDDVKSEIFTVFANAETTEGIPALELYYKYSEDNETWTEWTLFDTDTDASDGWSWEFNSPNETGHYHFYSIRTVEYEGYAETEKAPPGPDAFIYVDIN